MLMQPILKKNILVVLTLFTLTSCSSQKETPLFYKALEEEQVVSEFGQHKISQLLSLRNNTQALHKSLLSLADNVDSDSSRSIYYCLMGLFHYELNNQSKKGANYFQLITHYASPLFSNKEDESIFIDNIHKTSSLARSELFITELLIAIYPKNRPSIPMEMCFYGEENCQSLINDSLRIIKLFESNKILSDWFKTVLKQDKFAWDEVKQPHKKEPKKTKVSSNRKKVFEKRDYASKNSQFNHLTSQQNFSENCFTQFRQDDNRSYLPSWKEGLDRLNRNNQLDNNYLKEQEKLTQKKILSLIDRYDELENSIKKGIISEIPYHYTINKDYTLKLFRDGIRGENLIVQLKTWTNENKRNQLELSKFWNIIRQLNYEVKAYTKITGGISNDIILDLDIGTFIGTRKNKDKLTISNNNINVDFLSNYISNELKKQIHNKPFPIYVNINRKCNNVFIDQGEDYLVLLCEFRYSNLFKHELKKIEDKHNKLKLIWSAAKTDK